MSTIEHDGIVCNRSSGVCTSETSCTARGECVQPKLIVTRYRLIRAGAMIADPPTTVQMAKDPGYQFLQDLCLPLIKTARYVEHVSVLSGFCENDSWRRLDMFVDDEGKRKALPINEIASGEYQRNFRHRHPSCDPRDLDVIVGDAVIFDRRVWF